MVTERDNDQDHSPGDVPDVEPTEVTHRVYDSDIPRINLADTRITNLNKLIIVGGKVVGGEAVIFKHSFLQELWRTRGVTTTRIATMQWMSTITIQRTGAGVADWKRVSWNWIKEGSQRLELSPQDAQKAVPTGITVNTFGSGVNSPELTVPAP